jgi:acyl-CoA reductase-like NAD-dependent aldehyde dehydrogenase
MATRATETATATNGASGIGLPTTGETFDVFNPADGTVVDQVPVHDPAHIHAVAERLRAAQPDWQRLGHDGRYRWLSRWRDWMHANSEKLADIMQAETGKVRQEATMETPGLEDAINYFGSNSKRFLADEVVPPHSPLMRMKRLRVVYKPYPLVGVIAPWNFPLLLSAGDAIPALAAGCAVIIKPSEFTPLSLVELVRGWKEEVGAPDVFEVVTGLGECGSAVVDEVDMVHFTGSVATGKKVMAQAAEKLTPVSLELGGKDPMIVLEDADPDRAANGAAWGGLANSGQICMSTERVYATEPIYDRFVGKLVDHVKELKQGRDEPAYTHEIGAMVSPKQVDIVEDHVRDAVDKGARVLTGGKRREGPGDYFEPTVLVDVDHSMKIMQDETFGPVIPVMKVRDEDEAIELANDSRYGLSSSVFGKKNHAEAVARRIESGACNVNDQFSNYSAYSLPMAGWKESGIGQRWGAGGIRKYCRTEAITITKLDRGKSEPMWFPYTARRSRILHALAGFLNARGIANRLKGLRSR